MVVYKTDNRRSNIKVLLPLIFLLSSAYASTPVEVITPVKNVYSPKGFDSNDSSQIVISGYLPNLCHKSPKATFRVDNDKVFVTVTSLLYSESNPFCAEVLVPFLKTLDLGKLEKGTYDIIVNGRSIYEEKDDLVISDRTLGVIDQYKYPVIDNIEKNYKKRTVTIKGHKPSDCYELDRVEAVSNGEDTYSILPILRQRSDFCPLKLTPFSYEVEVPERIGRSVVLLHVRSMDDNSVNTLFDNRLR